MLKFRFLAIFAFLGFSTAAFCETFAGDALKQINHTFWIKFSDAESKLDYAISPEEIAYAGNRTMSPNIVIVGSLILGSGQSAKRCWVKLPSNILKAQNASGESIDLQLSGTIGNKPLTTQFVQPEFDAFNEAHFRIEGYIDPSSYLRGLSPGSYNFKNNLNLTVEFHD